MMFLAKRYIFLCPLLLVIVMSSCRKPDTAPIVEEMVICCPGSYEQYTSSDYDYIWSPVFNPNWFVGPFTFLLEGIANQEAVFNPNNPNEIAFVKTNYQFSNNELWKFDFCTGESNLIVDNYKGRLDWGTNGWLIYTGSNNKIHKVRSNGDDLTILSDLGGVNSAGKWNPSGTMYWNNRDYTYFEDSNGSVVHQNMTYPFAPFGWFNDSVVFGWRNDNIYSLNVFSEELLLINSKTFNFDLISSVDLQNLTCYSNTGRHLLRYSLDGSNQLDTIREFIHSYSYGSLDYMDNKLVVSLNRIHWKDSLLNEQYLRSNILLLDSDGTNERMMELME